MVVAVTIYEGQSREAELRLGSQCSRRDGNDADGKELARYDLSDNFSTNAAMVFVELYRGPQGDIKVKAVGEGWESGLAGLATAMGVNVYAGSGPIPGFGSR